MICRQRLVRRVSVMHVMMSALRYSVVRVSGWLGVLGCWCLELSECANISGRVWGSGDRGVFSTQRWSGCKGYGQPEFRGIIGNDALAAMA